MKKHKHLKGTFRQFELYLVDWCPLYTEASVARSHTQLDLYNVVIHNTWKLLLEEMTSHD